MELYHIFDELIFEAHGVFRTNKYGGDEIIRMLNWLRQQSMCDQDKRARDSELRACWAAIELSFERARFLERAPKTRQHWEKIHKFVTFGEYEPKIKSRALAASKTSPYQNSSIPEIFSEMRKRVAAIRATELDRARLKKAFEEILREAAKPTRERDHKLIRSKWKDAHPTLKTFGILREFEDPSVKEKILSFLKGN